MRNKWSLISLVVLLVLLFTGCQSGTSTNELNTEEDFLRIAVLIYRFDDEFVSYVMEEIVKEKELLGAISNRQLVVDFIDGRNQSDLQLSQIEESIEDGYDALAVNLVDRSQAAKVIEMAKAADTPIVFFNREPVQVDMARWDKTYYVGSKGEDAGRIQGEIVVNTWNKNPAIDKNGDEVLQYIMLEGQPGHQDAILRTETSVKAIETSGIETELLVADTANWQRQEAKEKMLNYLDIFRDEVEFIISNNDMMAIGAIDAMKELEFEKEDYIPIVGVDAIDIAVAALERGELVGTVYNDHVKQGQMVLRLSYYLAIDEDPRNYIEEIEDGKYYRVEYKKVTNESVNGPTK